MGPARHPIRAEVPDVDHATANFDAITYVKGQSVLHQLMAYIGEDAFVGGLRAYFRDHAWGNTGLDDLMSAFGEAAGTDLTGWTAAWLDRAGTDTLRLADGAIHVESPDDGSRRAPTGSTVGQLRRLAARRSTPVATYRRTARRARRTPVDLPDADLHLVNASDPTFAAVRPDDGSLRTMLDRLGDLPDPLSRALVVATVNQLLLLGRLAPREGARAVIGALRTERNPSLVEPFLTRRHDGLRPVGRPGRLPRACWPRSPTVPPCSPRCPSTGNPRCARSPPPPRTDAHWAVLDEAVAAADDLDLAWRATARALGPARLRRRRRSSACSRATTTPRPTSSSCARSRPRPTSTPRSRSGRRCSSTTPSRLAATPSSWARPSGGPAQAELLRPYAERYLDALPQLTGGLLQQGLLIRRDVPATASATRTFLDRARAMAEDESLEPLYARNQLRAGSFTLSRILAARAPLSLSRRPRRPCAAARSRRSGTARTRCRSIAAPTRPANSGCGRVGRERSSGWAWVAT